MTAELEEPPLWADATSGLVLLAGVLVAAHVLPIFALLPLLVVSSLGRRFSSRAVDPEAFREDVIDAWRPRDEPRVVLARGPREAPRIEVLVFDTVEAAAAFGKELPPTTAIVAGHAPGPRDLLPGLRFVGIALAFVGTGSSLGALTLVFFALAARAVLKAKQLVVTEDRAVVRGLLGTRSLSRAEAAAMDADDLLAVGATRDRLLAAPAWLEGARARALEAVRVGPTADATRIAPP